MNKILVHFGQAGFYLPDMSEPFETVEEALDFANSQIELENDTYDENTVNWEIVSDREAITEAKLEELAPYEIRYAEDRHGNVITLQWIDPELRDEWEDKF